MSRKRVILHGYLKDLWSGEAEFEAESAAEAINAFCKQTKALNPTPGKGRHRVRVVGFDTSDELFAPTDVKEIHLVPDFAGGKKGGFVQILVGAVLIAASFTGIGAIGLVGSTTLGSIMFSVGASLVLGGLMQLMSPQPKLDTSPQAQDPEPSRYLGAPKNTVRIGTRIPLLYGEHIIYGHYISFDIQAKDVAV